MVAFVELQRVEIPRATRSCRAITTCIFAASSLGFIPASHAESYYTERPDDARAVYVTKDHFPVQADGVADDTVALQQAIDRVQETTRRGIVFIPEGSYRLTATLHVWSGIRLIGYGAHRPVLLLGENTPGFQEGAGRYLVQFASDRPSSPGQPVRDANPGTFYSALSNIDIEIRSGNPAAVGVRSHYAQHCFLAHMDFRVGDGRAGVEEVGNLSEDLHFHGGEFGITMHKPSPSWPFLLIDSTFDGQRRAAIETEEGGLTLVRVGVADTPTAVLVRPERSEELVMKDSRLERLTGPAVVISEENSARTQITIENTVCAGVPILASFRESGRQVLGAGPIYRVREFSHGLSVADPGPGHEPKIDTRSDLEPLAREPAAVASDVAPLPPMDTWANLLAFGAKGDGSADDTAALRSAIAGHRTVYLPQGRYRISDTVTLRPDTVLVGLNPITTQILITDFTAAFQGVNGPTERPKAPAVPAAFRGFFTPPPFPGKGSPVPMIEAPRGGKDIVSGIGLDTGGVNNRAVALKWTAGANSLVNDVRFLGGHGTYGTDGQWLAIYNDNRTGDPDPQRRWDSQFWSLWVTDGGGGTFMDIWTPSPFAAAGLYVSNTSTPGRVYALSSEHHVRNEVKMRNASNWQIYALQTEEERGESPQALPLEMTGCESVTVNNFFIYRVEMAVPFDTGIRVADSRGIHFHGLHAYSPGKLTFDNTLVDETDGVRVRSREVADLEVEGAVSPSRTPEARVERIAGGFTSIDGAAVDTAGNLFFVDQAPSRIYRLGATGGGVLLFTDAIPQPVVVAADRSGDLLVVSRQGNVYALKPGAREEEIAVLEPEMPKAHPGATAWLPGSRWRDSHDFEAAIQGKDLRHYVSPDGTIYIPAPEAYSLLAKPGRGRGYGTIDVARAYSLVPAHAGEPCYVSDEFSQKTWRFAVKADGALGGPSLFAEEGEAGTAVDADGNVYVCAGEIFVYDPQGREIDRIDVPERPSAIVFGGPGLRTLFIAARTSLYAYHPRVPGRPAPGSSP